MIVIPIDRVLTILFNNPLYYLIYLGKGSISKPLVSLYLL